MTSRRVIPPRGIVVSIVVLLAITLAGCGLPGGPPSRPRAGTTPAGTTGAPPTTMSETHSPPAPATSTRTGTAPAPPTATPTPSQPPAAGRRFTVIGSGDVLLHDALWAQAQRDARAAGGSGYDFNPLFASLKPAIEEADLAICHLETPLGPESGPFSSFPIFSVPPQVVPALAGLGYDTCSTASNHSLDTGERGITRTLDALDDAGLKHTGTARSRREAGQINLLTVKDVVVGHLSYTFSFNGLVRPRGKEWLANYLRAEDVLAAAKRARRAGAEVVIVSIHWGSEYRQNPNSQQLSLARTLLASPDIDLILGHHAHVVQPLERLGDKWVAYGMGNEVAWQNFSDVTQDGILPRFTFTEVRPGVFRVTAVEVRAIHMWLQTRPARVYDIATVLASPSASVGLKRACEASLRRTERVVGQRGAYDDGLVLAAARR